MDGNQFISMNEKGYLLIVLQAHQPFIRHPESDNVSEENWLCEAITECYLPLAKNFQQLADDGIDYRITFSMTPCLIEMLTDGLLRQRYVRYTEECKAWAKQIMQTAQGDPHRFALASFYNDFFLTSSEQYQAINQDLVSAFRHLQDAGCLEITTSCATHAYLPLLESFPQLQKLQIEVGVREYERIFGRKACGFWLPECGFAPGVDAILEQYGIKYFFLSKHGILNGNPRPKFGVYAPVHCKSGVAAFGLNSDSHHCVWTKERGYPGDPVYLNFDQATGLEQELKNLGIMDHTNKRIPSSIKFFRNGSGNPYELYDPKAAYHRCDVHADHFIWWCKKQVQELYGQLDRKPVIVALFDAEHFGHWWREGPQWLDLVIRKLACDQQDVKLVTATDYLKLNNINQEVTPSMSSWGYQGYSETWLMGRNHWIYPRLYEAAERFDSFVKTDPNLDPIRKRAASQYLRELLVAQSSDWAYILHQETATEYAEQRVRQHIANMVVILRGLQDSTENFHWLAEMESRNKVFYDMDLFALYKKILLDRKAA